MELIRGSGALVSMTVVSLSSVATETCVVPSSKSQGHLSTSGRPYAATLPRKGAGGRKSNCPILNVLDDLQARSLIILSLHFIKLSIPIPFLVCLCLCI